MFATQCIEAREAPVFLTAGLALLAALALGGCNACGVPRGQELASRQLAEPQRDPVAELWALGPPDATLALVVPDLRPLARVADELRQAALAAPRGSAAATHLETMLAIACPACPRRGADLERNGVGAPEGLALFITPRERVLAVGCLRTEPVLQMIGSLLRRVDASVRHRTVAHNSGPLAVIDGVTPWYCRRVASRLVCASAPASLDAALARRPAGGLWQKRIAGRFPLELHGAHAALYLDRPRSPDLWALQLLPDRVRLRSWTRPSSGALRPAPRAAASTLLGVAEGADGLVRLNIAWDRLRPALHLPDSSADARRPLARIGLNLTELGAAFTGEALLFKTGLHGFGLVLGLRDSERLRPQLQLALRALQVLRFAHQFRTSAPARVTAVTSETVEEHGVATIHLRLDLQELADLPAPLVVTLRVHLGVGPDCLVLTTEREALRRALRPALRRPASLAISPADLHLRPALGPSALLTVWSRALDPLSGLPASFADALVARALRDHDDLRDALQAARFLADLTHDVTIVVRNDGPLVTAEAVLRPLHVDDDEHRAARPRYLDVLRARYGGPPPGVELQALLTQVATRHPATRYAQRARLLADGDPLVLASLVTAALALVGQELRQSLGDILGVGRPTASPRGGP